MKALLLCAGEGTRLRPYTLHTPKPAIPFLGAPLATYTGRLLVDLGVNKFVVNHHHLPTQIQLLFSENTKLFGDVIFSNENQKILGSAGALNKARQHFENESHFAFANGDEVILPNVFSELQKIWTEHVAANRLATLVVTHHPLVGTKFGGAWCDSTGRVLKFSKSSVANLTGWHFVGIMFLSNQIFKYLSEELKEENILYDTLTKAIGNQETVVARPLDCHWFETGNPEDFLTATRSCLDALTKTPRSGWANWLHDHLQKFKTPKEPLIESQDSLLGSQLRHLWSDLKG